MTDLTIVFPQSIVIPNVELAVGLFLYVVSGVLLYLVARRWDNDLGIELYIFIALINPIVWVAILWFALSLYDEQQMGKVKIVEVKAKRRSSK